MSAPQQEESRFTMTKAMVLASTDLKQRTAINSAASFLMDGHSVDISKELVEQKPSIVRSQEWTTTVFESPQSQANPGIIRVCWQCPETSSALNSRSNLAATLVRD